ncbi:OmpL47-type beta-barrel domain-containing protein [Flexithrix dorotheae]|uniref:OmpL47-type beta-barrel domain-containing protein n=1 Tax=Flexithrix dorotheae TaxID=70993 RepID=UPI0012F8A270|nr:hypothetical protein [Flexithrix dorotheae]
MLNRIILLLMAFGFMLILNAPLMAQQPLEHEKTVIKKENGTIYWHGDLPVYFFISTNKDGSNPILLEKGNAEKYTNPYFFDTEGVNFVRTRWAIDPATKKPVVPALEVEFEVERDLTAPKSSLSLEGAPKFVAEGKLFYGKSLKGVLKAEDEISGVKTVYHAINGAAYSAYQNQLDFSKEGDYSLNYYSVDIVGNPEEPRSKIFTVDATAPITNYILHGDRSDNILSPRTTIALSSTDAASQVKHTYYEFEGKGKQVYGTPLKMSSLADGEHVLKYYSTDNVENEEGANSYAFYLDKTAPDVMSEMIGARYQNGGKTFVAGQTKLKLTARDNKAGVENIYYSVDGGEFLVYNKPFILDKKQGSSIVRFYAIDKVKNKGKSQTNSEMGNLYLDLTAPKVSNSYSGPQFFNRDTMFITSETEIILKATDYESGVEKIGYSINKGSELVYNEPFKIEKDGYHDIEYFGADHVANRRKDNFFLIVDNKGPEIFYHLSMDAIGSMQLKDHSSPLPVYAAHTMLYLAATDRAVGTDKIFYSLDGEPERLYTQPLKTTKKGLRTLTVRAVDQLGNETKSELIEIVIQ